METTASKLQYQLLAGRSWHVLTRQGLSGESEEGKAGAGSEKCILLKHLGWSPFSLLVCQTHKNVPRPRSTILHKLSDSCIDFKTIETFCTKLGALKALCAWPCSSPA